MRFEPNQPQHAHNRFPVVQEQRAARGRVRTEVHVLGLVREAWSFRREGAAQPPPLFFGTWRGGVALRSLTVPQTARRAAAPDNPPAPDGHLVFPGAVRRRYLFTCLAPPNPRPYALPSKNRRGRGGLSIKPL